MRSILPVLLVACTTQAPSGSPNGTASGKADGDGTLDTLLDCNTSVGPDQQVTVVSDGSTLTLRELTTDGAEVDRTLAPSEWESESIQLRDDLGDPTTMSKQSGSWIVQSASALGYADCWVDQAP